MLCLCSLLTELNDSDRYSVLHIRMAIFKLAVGETLKYFISKDVRKLLKRKDSDPGDRSACHNFQIDSLFLMSILIFGTVMLPSDFF